ncbi:MAG TPA: DUF4199 domain-containing protein [Chitinophagaceae bacterium]|nr:DUF4199 domain-containing protein [Chitinophagaceae bacterium]
MKRTILRYGLISSLIIVILFLLEFFIFRSAPNYDVQEIFGYTSMIVSMLLVFFGIKHYRDKENNGRLTFGRGMKVGVLIVLIPSVAFGIFNLLYVTVINPGFMKSYYQFYLAKMQQSMPAAEFVKAKAELDAQMAMFSNPIISSLVMAVTVFLIGLIITVISSLILRRNARAATAS